MKNRNRIALGITGAVLAGALAVGQLAPAAFLRLQVIGRNLRALDQDPVLARIRFLDTAVEEEGL